MTTPNGPFQCGFFDAAHDCSLDQNPYSESKNEHHEWICGWLWFHESQGNLEVDDKLIPFGGFQNND